MISSKDNELTLTALTELSKTRLQNLLAPYLTLIAADSLKSAISYTLQNRGKHLRPLLIYATGLMFAAPWENMDLPACAVELIHTYSLIHDDLPCMDNADLRRGQPTCHKVYSEGMAVLTGDALHTLAIQILSEHPASLSSNNRLNMIAVLTRACGPYGMAAGQAMDIAMMTDKNLSIDTLKTIYSLKTGKLFSACVELGQLSADRVDDFSHRLLATFSEAIGLAFQIQDDILDIISPSENIGKPQGNDSQNNKITIAHQCGVKKATELVELLYNKALQALLPFGQRAQLLQAITEQMILRRI